MEDEIWETCRGYENYQVSSLGRVRRSVPSRGTWPGRVHRPWLRSDGYRCVMLSSRGRRRWVRVARLVCRAFHGRPRRYRAVNGRILLQEARHLDGDSANDNAQNLAWGTRTQILLAQSRPTEAPWVRGVLHPKAKLTEDDVLAIRRDPHILAKIAGDYGVCISSVWAIKNRVNWAWLD